MADKIKRVSVRFPTGLHQKIDDVSNQKHRSLHAQILDICETYFDVHRLRYRLAELERTDKPD